MLYKYIRIYIWWVLRGLAGERGSQLPTVLWNRNCFPHYIFCHCRVDCYHTHSDMTRIPKHLSAALFPNNCICLCLHLQNRLSHSTRQKSLVKIAALTVLCCVPLLPFMQRLWLLIYNTASWRNFDPLERLCTSKNHCPAYQMRQPFLKGRLH